MREAISCENLQKSSLLREVLVEVLDQRRDWFTAVVAEAMEDAALVRAIKEGEDTELASRDEVFQLLGGKS